MARGSGSACRGRRRACPGRSRGRDRLGPSWRWTIGFFGRSSRSASATNSERQRGAQRRGVPRPELEAPGPRPAFDAPLPRERIVRAEERLDRRVRRRRLGDRRVPVKLGPHHELPVIRRATRSHPPKTIASPRVCPAIGSSSDPRRSIPAQRTAPRQVPVGTGELRAAAESASSRRPCGPLRARPGRRDRLPSPIAPVTTSPYRPNTRRSAANARVP